MTYTATYQIYGDDNYLHDVEETIDADDETEAKELAEDTVQSVLDDETDNHENYGHIDVRLVSVHDEDGHLVA